MDPGEECPMKGTAGAKALRLETQCERGGDEQRGDGAGRGVSHMEDLALPLSEMEPQDDSQQGRNMT